MKIISLSCLLLITIPSVSYAQDATSTRDSDSGETLTTVTLYAVPEVTLTGPNKPVYSVTAIGTAEDGSETTYSIVNEEQSEANITIDNIIVESASGFRHIVHTQVLSTTRPLVVYENLPYYDCTFQDGSDENGTVGICEKTFTGTSTTTTFTGDVVAFATITAAVQDDTVQDDNGTQDDSDAGGSIRPEIGKEMLVLVGITVLITVLSL
ncbi:hypothetical protein VKT23_006089 [Stygiomarasmius scandens]|uniref:PGF-CTERM sorting domain-containing protein n=1 Tax=Marasmiellus scandens TaxID=2682957 RepID=A0ABR1JTW8_9AGAR